MIERLETARLILRKFTEADLKDFFAYARNPNVGPAAGWKPHETEEETLQVLKSFMAGNEVWAIELKKENRVVGSIGLHPDEARSAPKVKSLGFVLGEEYWGQGFMTEAAREVLRYAFEDLELELVSVAHYPFNGRSKRVIEKCGFKFEGTLRHARQIFDGTVYDVLSYSITKREWQLQR